MALTSVLAPLHFLKKLEKYKTEKPFEVFLASPPPEDDTRELSNCEFERLDVPLTNARTLTSPLSLQNTGCEYLRSTGL